MDPHSFEKLDPDLDPHSPKKLDLDPHKVNTDSKHWIRQYIKFLEIIPRKVTIFKIVVFLRYLILCPLNLTKQQRLAYKFILNVFRGLVSVYRITQFR
jgi:hypothetical protein